MFPVLGGIFLDKIGIGPGLIFFTVIIAFGQFVVCIGGYMTNFGVMVFGRALYGVGGDSQSVT